MYGLTQTVAPIGEPVSVEEAREWVRLTPDQKYADGRLGKLIRRARTHVEKITGRQLLTATWQMTLDGFPGMEGWGGMLASSGGPLWAIRMPKAPLLSVGGITYYDLAGNLLTVPTTTYDVLTSTDPGIISLAQYQIWPITRLRPGAVQITFTAGYGQASDVPDDIVHAIEMLVVYWFERHGDDGGEEPEAVARLLAGAWNGELEYGE